MPKPLCKRYEVENEDAGYDPTVPMTLELSVVLTCKLSEMDHLDVVVERLIEDLNRKLIEGKLHPKKIGGRVYPLSQEKLLMILPRKKHLKVKAGWACSTAYVSAKNLTEDPSEVTCKLCKSEMGG